MASFGYYNGIHYLVKSETGCTYGGAQTLEDAQRIKAKQEREYRNYPKRWGKAPVFHIETID